jgi:hypothetical protein
MPGKKKKPSAARPAAKKRPRDSGPNEALTSGPELPPRPGMPAQDSIISETTFTSPKGNVYHIYKTNEMDEYDKPLPPQKKRRPRR